MKVRWALKRDLPVISRIDASCFGDVCWGHDQHADFLKQRNGITMVAESDDGQVSGFVCYRLAKDCFDVDRVCVDPYHQRQGVGRMLLEKMERKLCRKRSRLYTVVDEWELSAQLWLRACGWRCTGAIKPDVIAIIDGVATEDSDLLVFVRFPGSDLRVQDTQEALA